MLLMSIASELKRRAGPLAQVRAARFDQSNSGGERVDLVLKPPRSRRLPDGFEVARLLVRSGVPVRAAKKVVDQLMEGKTAYVVVPAVADYGALRRKMMAQKVKVRRIELRAVDVRVLRARLGISQEEFAGRYGLDVATIRNWEQGRTKPEGPAAALLQLIDRDPDKVIELLAS
jgi:DNA-binding transcriptional regulator YiaG